MEKNDTMNMQFIQFGVVIFIRYKLIITDAEKIKIHPK